MIWYIIAGIAFALALGLLIYTFVRDRRYMRMKTSQAMSRELWAEIEQEREESLKRKDRWTSALTEAKTKERGSENGPH
ncbi:MAG: hypothetical protein WC956_03160 [bacterium]